MTDVWVLTRGRYSDYRVVGVFSSKERAVAYIDTFNELANRTGAGCFYVFNDPFCETLDVVDEDTWASAFFWKVVLRVKDRSLYYCSTGEEPDEIAVDFMGVKTFSTSIEDRPGMTKEDACKIANERLSALLAEKALGL